MATLPVGVAAVAAVAAVLALAVGLSCAIEAADEVKTFRTASNRSNEKTLIRELLQQYKKAGLLGRPVKSSGDMLEIKFGLAVVQILDLDENGQFLRTNCWLRYQWLDPLLDWQSWNDSRFVNITQVRLYPELVWTPDIQLFNYADERLKDRRMARIVVYSSGFVLWVPQGLFKSTCPVEIDYFPFDTQICFLEFGSGSYDATQLNITWYGYEYEPNKEEPNPYIDFHDYIKSHEWYTDGQDEYKVRPSRRTQQIRSKIKCRRQRYKDALGNEYNRTYKRLEYKLRIRRNPDFYIMILVLPCILLSCLTWVIFWLPPESPAKTQLGMNIFVAFNILMLLLAKTTPSNSRSFPLIGYFYAFNMTLITLSTFLAVLVINLYLRSERRGPMHPLVRNLVVEGLGRLFLVRQTIPLQASTHKRAKRMPQAKGSQAFQLSARSLTEDKEDSPLHSRISGAVERQVREVKHFLKVYVGRLKEKDKRNVQAVEWRAFAIVLDRIFFTTYVIFMIVAVIVFIPRSHLPYVDHSDPTEEDFCSAN